MSDFDIKLRASAESKWMDIRLYGPLTNWTREVSDTLGAIETNEYYLIGYVREGNGTPISGVTVLRFRTSNSEYIDSVITDSNGMYRFLVTDRSIEYFLIVFKPNSPDEEGCTYTDLKSGAY